MNTGISNFLECCRNDGLSCDLFCIGISRKETRSNRYQFNTSNKLELSHKYAVKYIAHEDFFICWKAHIKKRKVYSVSKTDVQETLERDELIVKKGVEFKWRMQENVYVFKSKDIKKFLEYIN